MQFKSLLLPLVILASGSNIHASATFHGRDPALGARNLAARTGTTTSKGTTVTVTKTVTSTVSTSTSTGCNWCECFTALAAEGIACAAAILEGGCNLLADLSCIIDAAGAAEAIGFSPAQSPFTQRVSEEKRNTQEQKYSVSSCTRKLGCAWICHSTYTWGCRPLPSPRFHGTRGTGAGPVPSAIGDIEKRAVEKRPSRQVNGYTGDC
ncbi:hypothetical protein B0H17DRAFT_1145190 [Mycena rosella]|uniref:Fungal calcium binding protein domain-containing protein n=1 Tax=Mycena rosella TaxID=1033263 RepID=A0AAD7CRC0_MYCRO|nr:hypothetical protein B0H17DRAFT_1145190 [Mycena rosella]